MKHVIPPAVLEQHLALLGKTGRGKTNTAKVCVEQVYDQDSRVCILDTIKSDWWGLTSSADGRRAGLPFHILGGPHAHFPLTASMGKPIADLVARGELKHTIIDMAEFEPGGQMRFFVDFAPRLMQRMKGVLHLVIEEAHLLAPKERSGMGFESMSIHWAKMLATAGRTRGIRLLILSQRTQAVHNAVLGSCDSMIVHGMTAPADMEPVVKWLKANSKDKERNATIEGSLSGLKRGTGWLCSSESGIFELREFPKARTYDNTATPTDDEELLEVKTAPIDVEKLRAILGKAAAEAEANDPKILHKRIAELEAQVRKGGNGPDPQIVARELQRARNDASAAADMARHAGYKEGAAEGYRQAQQTLYAHVTSALGLIQETCSKQMERTKTTFEQADFPKFEPKPAPKRSRNDVVITKGNNPLITPAQSAKLLFGPETPLQAMEAPTGLKAKILGALRWLEDKGLASAPRATVGALAGVKAGGGYAARIIGELQTAELIEYPVPGSLALTDQGRTLAPEPPAYDSQYEAWLALVSGLHHEILETLYEWHPNSMTREELGKALGKASEGGYFARVIGELATMQAIYYPVKGSVALSQYVMPE